MVYNQSVLIVCDPSFTVNLAVLTNKMPSLSVYAFTMLKCMSTVLRDTE